MPSRRAPRRCSVVSFAARSRQARPGRSRGQVEGSVGSGRRLSVRPHARPARRCIRSIRPRRPSADRCTSATSSPTRTRMSSRASTECAARPSSIRWAGTTTGCRPSAGSRTSMASVAIRRCRTIRRSRRRHKPDKQPLSISRPNFVELCVALTAEDEKAFEASLAARRAVGRLVDDLRDDLGRHAPRLAAVVSSAASMRDRRTSSRRRRSGTSISGRLSRRRSSRTGRCPAPTTAIRFRQADGASALEIDTTRPELIPACVALVAHPDDPRYRDVVRSRGADTALRRLPFPCGPTRLPIRRRAPASR